MLPEHAAAHQLQPFMQRNLGCYSLTNVEVGWSMCMIAWLQVGVYHETCAFTVAV